jgi:predicted Fe-S protein YdhL (DUF1289 family)
MEQLEFFPVPNPCVGVCDSDEKGYCKGCMRKRSERFAWQTMSIAEQKHIVKLCMLRYRRKQKTAATEKSKSATTTTNPQQDMF